MPHNHHNFLHFFHNRELNELYISIAIKSFALSLVGIFIPIYLVQAGYSLPTVFLFFTVLALVHALSSFHSAKLAAKFGFKHNILFSIPFLIAALGGLYILDFSPWIFYIIAVLFGVSNSLFWIGYHVDFAKFSDKKNRGKEAGITRAATFLFHAAGPVIGGVILTFVGFKILFIASAGLLFLSATPLFYSKDIHIPAKISLKGVFRIAKIRDVMAFVGFGFDRAVGYTAWPLFIFFFILGENYTSLGAVASVTLIFSTFFVIIIGKFSDIRRRLVLRVGAIFNSVVWFVKGFVQTTLHVFIVDGFYGVAQTTMTIPFDALSYDKANKNDVVKFIVLREFTINMGRTFIFFIMIFVTDLVSSFIFGGSLGSLLHLFF